MKLQLLIALTLFLLSCSNSSDTAIIVQAENFTCKGGWSVDPQFTDQVGSSYLLAHGLGVPVDDAYTSVDFTQGGKWHMYVRTYDWTRKWDDRPGPGKFEIYFNKEKVGNNPLGCSTTSWQWEYVGEVEAKEGGNSIALHDLTGFDGRVDAICFTSEKENPENFYSVDNDKIDNYLDYDFVVVGGGVSGMCAAASAARLGLKVALVNDFEILGGNNSSLVRVHLGGGIGMDPYPNLGNLLREFAHTKPGNAAPAENYEDGKKTDFIYGENNITLYTPYHFIKAGTSFSSINYVLIRHNENGKIIKLNAPIFADCTGDGTLGVSAGADYHYGRESKEMYGENTAPEIGDSLIMGASIQWNSIQCTEESSFPLFDYGATFSDASAERTEKGDWQWETGMNKDMINEAENIRDYGMAVVYSNWSYLKNNLKLFPERKLAWVSYVLGKRESRRLLGDVILTENDILKRTPFEDSTVTTTWSIDLHYADKRNSEFFPGKEFKTFCTGIKVKPYPIPYRCFYSRNIRNLFMAGRDISVSHVALGTTRVMRTCAMEGEVVGMAASLCKKHDVLPRDIYSDYFSELVELMKKGTGHPDSLNNQNFNKW